MSSCHPERAQCYLWAHTTQAFFTHKLKLLSGVGENHQDLQPVTQYNWIVIPHLHLFSPYLCLTSFLSPSRLSGLWGQPESPQLPASNAQNECAPKSSFHSCSSFLLSTELCSSLYSPSLPQDLAPSILSPSTVSCPPVSFFSRSFSKHKSLLQL